MSSEKSAEKNAEFEPTDHDPIGRCTDCCELVYPASPAQIGADEPVMHEECGW